MMKIGEFAKILGTSAQTLRFYDSEGVLVADKVDEANGYRYYHPDKIHTYRKIITYKELGFTLDEIKQLLLASDSEKIKLYINKQKDIALKIQNGKEQIALLEKMSKKDYSYTSDGANLLNIEFEDDPDAIGKWELIGILPQTTHKTIDISQIKPLNDEVYGRIFFLPGGAFYYGIFWSRGKIYRILHEYNTAVPNEYHIVSEDGQDYMIIDWIGKECLEDGKDSQIRVYRRIDNKAYTEQETWAFRDDVSRPFVADRDLLGIWDTCAFIGKDDCFDVGRIKKPEDGFWVMGLEISERGICRKILRSPNGKYKKLYSYTKGFILDKENEFAEEYHYKKIGNKIYLFVDHKSGDYKYLGKINGRYVFVKREV